MKTTKILQVPDTSATAVDYLKNDAEANGYDVVAIGDTLIAPLTLYSEKFDSLDALKAAAGKLG